MTWADGARRLKGRRSRADSHTVGANRGATPRPDLVLEGSPVLEFLPAVDLATGRLLGFEALLRWDHPTRGLIPPSILIPWAEANDHILELNAWVLSEACRLAAQWPSGIQLAVNCSLVQLRHRQASSAAARALADSGLNPDRLTIEITESAVADDRANGDLQTLSGLGIHLAVDDVGTSWSTLENLRRFAIETAKIDRAFIAALEPEEGMHRAIVEAIIHVSHSLAISTVAEGVETAQQVAILRSFGADVAQGYFFSPPMAVDAAHALARVEPRAIFALTVERTGATAEVQPPTLTVVTGAGESRQGGEPARRSAAPGG